MDCIDLEKKHPGYKAAEKSEIDAVKKGIRNFPGVGLPEGYTEWSKEQ